MMPCPNAKKCGGCQLQNLSYEEQLSFKMAKEIKLLGSFCHVNEIIPAENPTYYRCKVQSAFGRGQNGKPISGVYQSSTHKIVAVDSCMIENQVADKIIVSIRKLITEFRFPNDYLRHVLVRVGYYTNQVMVVLVVRNPSFPSKDVFVSKLLEKHPEITTLVMNINNAFTSLVLGNKNITLFGKGYIEDKLCGLTFRISPNSFYQINPVMTEVLYNKAIEYIGLTGKERVIDAYCGTGTIGLIASKNAKEVIGTEVNADAVKDAISNAKYNNIQNIHFVKMDATDFMAEMQQEGETADALIMDPPRAGSTNKFIHSAVSLGPKKIVYVSCNPETLARDLYQFKKNNYQIKRIQPVDMFPYTEHVETVVLMVK